jgi:predicted outer membrane repeat protein
MKKTISLVLIVFTLCPVRTQAQNSAPVVDAGLPRYAGPDPVVLDGTGSYDPDNSGTLSYAWRQISGPAVTITDANTATPTISGFVQTEEIQECEFELVVSDGELTCLPDTVKVIVVPNFGKNILRLANDSFDPNKPTYIWFAGGNCIVRTPYEETFHPNWLSKTNMIHFPYYEPDPNYKPGDVDAPRTYYRCGDMIIVYLSSVAPDYLKPIQSGGWSTGGQPAIDVGIHLNLTYADARYAVNRVTLVDARACRDFSDSIPQFLDSSVEGEQCWIDNHRGNEDGPFPSWPSFYPDVLRVGLSLSHTGVQSWYANSLTYSDMNQFNHGVVGGVYWSVVGPGKNLQLASTPGVETYSFKWVGTESYGHMDFWDEPNHPGRLPEPVTLVGPEDGVFVDVNGAVFSCEVSENAVGYQLLFGPDPYRVMDYYVISDTSSPPTEVITSSPFEQTWWTVKVYDQYGSTIYADPIKVNFENLGPPIIENITTGQRYTSVRCAIDEALHGHDIVVSPGIYKGDINFQGKNLTLRSKDPNDPATAATTVIEGYGNKSVVTFSNGEDANCILAGFTITGGKRGIYCSGASPTILNCVISRNSGADMGAGMYIKDGSSPVLVNCTFSDNFASMTGGGIQNWDSNPVLINCTFTGNSATYFGGGIYCAGGSPVLTNCILWGDTPDEVFIFGGTPVITYSDIQGGWEGEGNIDVDPLFADAANGDFHLLIGSPCIDAGDPSTPVASEPLPNGGRINMGAYGGTPQASLSP